ncbi:hypothetical protein NECAME_16574 [Necator americanus]|uniref:Uncharacterized protein n=1 Tax=Necator americanus TaxID=51031 RepID=W2TV03_NECAM|nr:hypothetical protein NECAME_16574 [Necator americanus]ETN85930.1 hypothetical protein NECAME_16574 [Necator americanus]
MDLQLLGGKTLAQLRLEAIGKNVAITPLMSYKRLGIARHRTQPLTPCCTMNQAVLAELLSPSDPSKHWHEHSLPVLMLGEHSSTDSKLSCYLGRKIVMRIVGHVNRGGLSRANSLTDRFDYEYDNN